MAFYFIDADDLLCICKVETCFIFTNTKIKKNKKILNFEFFKI